MASDQRQAVSSGRDRRSSSGAGRAVRERLAVGESGDARRAVGTVRVSGLSITPVKGLALHHPSEVYLTRSGAAGDRRFLLLGDNDRPVSIGSSGALTKFVAEYDSVRGILTLRSSDGRAWSGLVIRSRPVEADFTGVRKVLVPCNLVEGPWASVFSEALGRRVRLVIVAETSGAFDVRAVTLLGRASVDEVARRAGLESIDSRRFRMLIELETDEAHVEDSWEGSRMRIGEAEILVRGAVPRCTAITRDPDSGGRDLPLVRAIKAYRGVVQTEIGPGVPFGVYADVVCEGRVRLGDYLSPCASDG